MGIVNRVDGFAAPIELASYARSRQKVEDLIGESLTDDEWDFVHGELAEICEVDPLCSGIPAPEGIYNDDDGDYPEEYDEDFDLWD